MGLLPLLLLAIPVAGILAKSGLPECPRGMSVTHAGIDPFGGKWIQV